MHLSLQPKHRVPPPLRGESHLKKGFTLIEIVIVLLVIGVITAGVIASLMINDSERTLTTQSGEIELLAKKARTVAILNQKPYAIEFHPGSVKLVPFTQSSNNERTTAQGNEIGGTSSESSQHTGIQETINIDPDIQLTIRHWNTEKFLIPDEKNVPVWRFDPDGLCEPITVRLVMEKSYAQDTYHPLTATIADSELEAY
ncbi:MAG: prepilin-type N-terminal cleavage/methylation domain-containing protein [Akkermansiaceae bacterium]|nr:prepilin-type N-terminal cleavage/methylation domain-containing protein [Luteolibacter sp.]